MKSGAYLRNGMAAISSLLILALAGGCSDDATSPEVKNPEPAVAAELSQAAQTSGMVGSLLQQLELFQNPMSCLAEDAGIYQEIPLDGWTGDDISFPAKSAQTAASFRQLRDLMAQTTALEAAKSQVMRRLDILRAQDSSGTDPFGKDAGDTIAVEYFDSPDSTGLNALIETDTQDLVRFVSLRDYPPRLGQVVRRDQEILLDTQGTLENPEDDEYHTLFHEQEMFGGEVATGTLGAVSGSGPLLPGVLARAVYHVEDPRFNILQEWTESVMTLDLGEFRVPDDEIVYGLEATVHWRSDAEHHAVLEAVGGGAIEEDTIVEARGDFTAAPANIWLEAINDTLRVQLGDLDIDEDDLLLEASRSAVFDGTASDGGHPRSYVHFLPDEPVPPGEEPCGGQAEQEVWYPATWWLVHLLREADIECDGSGSLHILMEMRDGSSYERWITWDGAGTASVTENRQDGTTVVGIFNETTGEYSLLTTFSAGHDPVSRDQHGQMLEGSLTAWDIVTWQDAHPDTTCFSATGDGAAFAATGYRTDGDLHEEFTLSGQEDESLAGTWSRNDGASGEFTLEAIEGGGQHLIFAAAAPNEPGHPSLSGEVWFAPDGSGSGTVTITQYGVSVTYEVTFAPDGTGTLDDGEGGSINI
jgi:hypothetical protein